MKITPNSIAAISYTLTNFATGEVLEKTPDDKVMKFKFGVGELLPDFEKNIVGLKAGDKFNFKVLAADAFGPVDPYAIFDIPKDTFETDGVTMDFNHPLAGVDLRFIGEVLDITE